MWRTAKGGPVRRPNRQRGRLTLSLVAGIGTASRPTTQRDEHAGTGASYSGISVVRDGAPYAVFECVADIAANTVPIRPRP